MKVRSDHKMHSTIFNKLLTLFERNYKMRNDDSDNALGIEVSVINKTQQGHGFNISTSLNPSNEWSINFFHLLPIENLHGFYYIFTPDTKKNGFPDISSKQFEIIKTEIKKLEEAALQEIKYYIRDLNDGMIRFGIDEAKRYTSNPIRFDLLKNYGGTITPSDFFLTPFKQVKNTYTILEVIMNAKDKDVKNLINNAIDMYLEQTFESTNDVLVISKAISRISPKIINVMNDKNIETYINLVIDIFPFGEDYDQIARYNMYHLSNILDIQQVHDRLYSYFYKITENENFLADDVKDIFFF